MAHYLNNYKGMIVPGRKSSERGFRFAVRNEVPLRSGTDFNMRGATLTFAFHLKFELSSFNLITKT